MPALAAIVNPAVADDKSVNLYYNTSTAQIALTLKSGSDGEDPDTDVWAAGTNDYSGYILNPSDIAGGVFRGVNIVVAVTKPYLESGANTQTVNQISLISPVYQKLASTSLANKTVTLASSGKHAWLYYLDGPSKGQVRLKEYNLVSGNVSTFLQNQDVALNCSLAAWYDPKAQQRVVVYQEMEEGHLKEYNVVKKQAWDIDGTGDAMDTTPLAVSYYNGKVYLFYTDRASNVKRVIKDATGWGDPHTVSGSPKVGTSQLAVVAANGYNHLFYLSQDDSLSDGFTHVRDPIQE